MSLTTDLIAAMQAYAEGSGDLDFIAAWGQPGRLIQIRGEMEETGQAWEADYNMAEGLFTAIQNVQGASRTEDFDAAVLTSVTLNDIPLNAGALQVFLAGVLLRRTVSPTLATEYSWNIGSKDIVFGAPVTGWVHVRYQAAV